MPATAFSAHSNILLLILLSAVLFSACTDLSQYDEMTINQVLADSLLSVTETRHLELDIIEDGNRVVSLQSPYATTYHDGPSVSHMKGPVLVFVKNAEGDTTTNLRSDAAVYTARETKFVFKGDVYVETEDGKKLYTELLNWNQKERSISTDEFVIITTPADSIAGYGLDGTDDLSNYTIRRVTGEFQVDDQE